MASKAPSWSDQWGSGNHGVEDDDDKAKGTKKGNTSKKLAEAKAVAAVGFDKAKAAAAVGAHRTKVVAMFSAHKVKTGTSAGIKWVKSQYQKRTSK